MFVRRSQATRLLYHILTGLSTTFFAFFKTFQIVCSEETILRDSSVRITLSNRAVNTFFNILQYFLIVLHKADQYTDNRHISFHKGIFYSSYTSKLHKRKTLGELTPSERSFKKLNIGKIQLFNCNFSSNFF